MLKLRLLKAEGKYDAAALFQLRTQLVAGVDPLRSPGANLQEVLLKCNRQAVEQQPATA